jgi:ethanolamine-phosphate cytidylyltransferase
MCVLSVREMSVRVSACECVGATRYSFSVFFFLLMVLFAFRCDCVALSGGFDVFHAGHIAVLEEARSFGDYLIVGVHSDQEINRVKGEMWPVMNLQERVLGLLGCRYVDECVIGAPYSVSKEMIDTLNIHVVLHGSQYAAHTDVDGGDPYRVAKEKGIFQVVKSPLPLTTTDVVERIVANATAFLERNRKKEKRELDKIEDEPQESHKKSKTDA